MLKYFQKLRSILLPKEKRRLLIFTALLIFTSFVEVITLLVSFSVLSILFGNTSGVSTIATLDVLSQMNTKSLILILLSFATLKIMSIVPIYFFEAKLKTQISTRLSTRLYNYYLNLPYMDFISSEKAALARNVQDVYLVVHNSVFPLMAFVSESIFLIGLVIILFLTAPTYSLVGVFAIALIGLIISKANSTLSTILGDRYNSFAKVCSVDALEGLNSGAEVRMFNAHHYFVKKFSESSYTKLKALFKINIFSNISTHALEFVLIFTTSLIILVLESSGDLVSSNLQILSILTVSALRAVPSVGKLNACVQSIKFSSATLAEVTDELSNDQIRQQSEISESELNRNSDIHLRSVNFGYPNMNSKLILNDLNASFKFGEITVIVGPNGTGKTSLINLLTGLFEPQSGEIFLGNTKVSTNNRGWRNKVGFVPQKLSLINSTIFENVVFGRSGISDLEIKVDNALNAAGLRGFINGLTLGQSHLIGENGNKLSGGERQKLGIARAILLTPPILVFDELSNFLDNLSVYETIKILESFRDKHTVILVTHDKRILAIADQVIELSSESTVLQ